MISTLGGSWPGFRPLGLCFQDLCRLAQIFNCRGFRDWAASGLDFGLRGGAPETSARFVQIIDFQRCRDWAAPGLDFALWGGAPETSTRVAQIIDFQ